MSIRDIKLDDMYIFFQLCLQPVNFDLFCYSKLIVLWNIKYYLLVLASFSIKTMPSYPCRYHIKYHPIQS